MNKIKLENKLEETQASVLYGRNSLFYVETIIGNAINSKASDIHLNILDLNSSEKELQISYRIDGILVKDKFIHEKFGKQKINQNASEIISRIKILSGMNVAEKRLPQDGSISYEHNKNNWDIRVATLPAISGESIVIRILGNTLESVSLESLGFSKVNEQKIEKILQKKFGLILITGPTGSGKSTTMTTMINMLDIEHKKIITVEDPVESRINGVTQIQINEKIGLNFSEVLRSSLRNDPDVIVISEIRDEETAEIAIRAALTGHLVIATLHTNNAIGTITRLIDMGIRRYIVLDSLLCIIAQRLVRKKCLICGGSGCVNCNGGYSGRTTINEVLLLNDDVKEILKKEKSLADIEHELKKSDFKTMLDDCKKKINENIIDESEVFTLF